MSATLLPPNPPVTLDNCALEPIHIPGQIQPNGAMLVFHCAGQLTGWSANAHAMLLFAPRMGTTVAALPLDAAVRALLQEQIDDAECGDTPPLSMEVVIGLHTFDLVVHGHQGRVIAEFEQRRLPADVVAGFALMAHNIIDRIKRQKSVLAMLQMAVEQVRALTGFDRVMAYRFRQDDSGEVVAEACAAALDPYLGRRYPASDIPDQARRLYTINTLRLISDMGYQPVAMLGRPDDGPLDMSHCVLRSVSPIHVEYLQNMGVGASMSVSIVVNGRLWGLLACHHMGPRQVPYSVRMSCDVMAQVLASSVQTLEARERAELAEHAAAVRTRLMEALLHDDDVLRALAQLGGPLCDALKADALVATQFGKLITVGEVPDALAAAMVASLPAAVGQPVQRTCIADWPEAVQPLLGQWVGMLGLYFDPATDGWLLALRCEQIETVRWGGKPEKEVKPGPLGPRLTPRGSFDEWRQTVRGSAERWEEERLAVASQLLSEMHRASNARHAELERARTQLLAMLGHDLRDPLHTISMAATVLEQDNLQHKLGRRIQTSSGRMQRLITQVLDMSRIKGGMGLGLSLAPVDLHALIHDLVDESRTAHPGVRYELELAQALPANLDGDRIAQVFSNLFSNARHHGELGHPIKVTMRIEQARAYIQVRNVGAPIAGDVAATLFNPFKRTSLHNQRNRTGMGLGLYIAHEIVRSHQGALDYAYDAPHVVFALEVPLNLALPQDGGEQP